MDNIDSDIRTVLDNSLLSTQKERYDKNNDPNSICSAPGWPFR